MTFSGPNWRYIPLPGYLQEGTTGLCSGVEGLLRRPAQAPPQKVGSTSTMPVQGRRAVGGGLRRPLRKGRKYVGGRKYKYDACAGAEGLLRRPAQAPPQKSRKYKYDACAGAEGCLRRPAQAPPQR